MRDSDKTLIATGRALSQQPEGPEGRPATVQIFPGGLQTGASKKPPTQKRMKRP